MKPGAAILPSVDLDLAFSQFPDPEILPEETLYRLQSAGARSVDQRRIADHKLEFHLMTFAPERGSPRPTSASRAAPARGTPRPGAVGLGVELPVAPGHRGLPALFLSPHQSQDDFSGKTRGPDHAAPGIRLVAGTPASAIVAGPGTAPRASAPTREAAHRPTSRAAHGGHVVEHHLDVARDRSLIACALPCRHVHHSVPVIDLKSSPPGARRAFPTSRWRASPGSSSRSRSARHRAHRQAVFTASMLNTARSSTPA